MPDHPAIFDQYRVLLETGHKRVLGGWMYEGAFYPDYLTVGGCSIAIQRTASRWCKGRGLDMGMHLLTVTPIHGVPLPSAARGSGARAYRR